MSKILFYMPSFGGGGAERNGALLAIEFSRRGHKVLMTVDRLNGPNRKLLPDSVEVYSLTGNAHAAQTISLRRVLRSFRPDIIYALHGLSIIKILLATAGILSSKKVVISYHSLYDPKGRPGGRMTYQLAALLTRLVGATIAVSSDVRNELVTRFRASKKHVRVVHNPVDIQWIEGQALMSKPSWLEGRRYILSAGRLVHQKDYGTLLYAFACIQGYIEHDLVIIGEGPLRQNLETLIDELGLNGRVYMPGYLPNPFPVYRDADLFALSSAFEGFGNVLIEAMALGVPVVATRCPGGPREILAEGRYGTLVPVGEPKTLGEAILSTLADPLDSEMLKIRAKDFSLEKVGDIYLRTLGKGV